MATTNLKIVKPVSIGMLLGCLTQNEVIDRLRLKLLVEEADGTDCEWSLILSSLARESGTGDCFIFTAIDGQSTVSGFIQMSPRDDGSYGYIKATIGTPVTVKGNGAVVFEDPKYVVRHEKGKEKELAEFASFIDGNAGTVDIFLEAGGVLETVRLAKSSFQDLMNGEMVLTTNGPLRMAMEQEIIFGRPQ